LTGVHTGISYFPFPALTTQSTPVSAAQQRKSWLRLCCPCRIFVFFPNQCVKYRQASMCWQRKLDQ